MFTKLFSSITTSSIWNENNNTRILWITMLAMANKNGYVAASVGGLAHEARITREDCEAALNVLISPDIDSRSKEFEGKRVAIIDGGFQLLNYPKYRAMRSEEERKEYMKTYMSEYRKARNVNKIVNNVSECKPPLAAVSPSRSRGEGDKNNTEEAAKAAVASKESPKTTLLINRWASEYERVFTEKYKVNWGKDGKAAKDLISHEPSEDKIMKIAVAAWGNLEGFRCKNAVTLSGLNGSFNEIRSELNQRLKGSKPKPVMKPSFDEIMEKQNENT